MSSITLLTPADHRRIPWKNGQGVTTELAMESLGNGVGDGRFLWRVSVADIVTPGPFSIFPGCDRLIAVVAGEGMRLSVDGAPPVERRRMEPAFAFSGDSAVWCEPTGGPIRDVNLMLDRTMAAGTLTLMATGVHRAAGDVVLVHVLTGTAALTLADGKPVTLSAGYGLVARDGAVVIDLPAGAEAVCAEVRRLEA